jgi:hypothetical protein
MSTYRTQTEEEEILNHLLEAIVIASGGNVTGGDKITLLKDWLEAVGG